MLMGQWPHLGMHWLPAAYKERFHDHHGREPSSLHSLRSSYNPYIYNYQNRECWLGSIHSIFLGTQTSYNGILYYVFPPKEVLLPHPNTYKHVDIRIWQTIAIYICVCVFI